MLQFVAGLHLQGCVHIASPIMSYPIHIYLVWRMIGIWLYLLSSIAVIITDR
jgi:hypothetical protein